MPTMMTAVYNQAKGSPCASGVHIAAEGGWDAEASGCMIAAAARYSGRNKTPLGIHRINVPRSEIRRCLILTTPPVSRPCMPRPIHDSLLCCRRSRKKTGCPLCVRPKELFSVS
jgi:hypothetical protein